MDDAAFDDAAPEDEQPPPEGGASSRLPWRYVGPGRARLSAMAATMPGGRGSKPGSKARNSGRRGLDVDDHIRHAIREESAATLGQAGRILQEAVAALADFDRSVDERIGREDVTDEPLPERKALVIAAAGALWHYVVQREAMGLTRHDSLEQVYGVTAELWRLMGSADVVGRQREQ